MRARHNEFMTAVGHSAIRRLVQGGWPGVILAAALHLWAIVRIFQTEFGAFGLTVCLLTWICLSCLFLLVVRRAALAAALSLGLVEFLILVSQFKFKITWMTATFLDVMLVDSDSLSFLMSVMPGIVAGAGLRCNNERCITNNEGVRYLVRDFRLREAEVPPVLSCAYCEREIEARFVGHAQSRQVYRYNAADARGIKAEHRVYFESEAQARAAGFHCQS